MSLPFFKNFGWEAEVVTVQLKHSEAVKDALFERSIPKDLKIHYVSAFDKKITSKVGLGSLALRSLWFFRKKVDSLLKAGNYDLIYFSTTEFPVCVLGAYWKSKFRIPYVIDMQDPWHSTYYLDKPLSQRPPKHWFSYRLNKFLEPIAMNKVDGIISVSNAYISLLKNRYKQISRIPTKVITFGYFKQDFEIADNFKSEIRSVISSKYEILNLVYIGRGGYDMQPAIRNLLLAFKELLEVEYELAKKLRFTFIGTSYAAGGRGKKTFLPIAEELDLTEYVVEQPDRISFYESIKGLQSADGLIIPGSADPGYTASKLFPYILARKPLLAIFNRASSAYQIVEECKAGCVVDLSENNTVEIIQNFLLSFLKNPFQQPDTDWLKFERYSAEAMTERQCNVFDSVIFKQPSEITK